MYWIFIVPIILLLVGLADMPTGYYTIVRIVVCLVSALCAQVSYKTDNKIGIATVAFTLLVVLFNPIIPVYLRDKGVWVILDLVAAALLAIRCFTLKRRYYIQKPEETRIKRLK